MIGLSEFHTHNTCVIAQPDGDLGDAPQRTAMFFIGRALLGAPLPEDFARAVEILHAERLIRDPHKWNDPRDISRDQQEPWLIALALYDHRAKARELIFNRWKRIGRYPNADIMNPTSLATDLRALDWRGAMPLIWFGDLWSVFGALIDCAKVWLARGNDGPWLDMDNALTRLAFASSQFPSPFSRLAQSIYARLFRANVGGPGVLGALDNKHRPGAGNPAMARLWREVWLNSLGSQRRQP